jgi:hypothetical protein
MFITTRHFLCLYHALLHEETGQSVMIQVATGGTIRPTLAAARPAEVIQLL